MGAFKRFLRNSFDLTMIVYLFGAKGAEEVLWLECVDVVSSLENDLALDASAVRTN